MHCRISSSIPYFYPLNASSSPLLSTTHQKFPDILECFQGRSGGTKLLLVENHWVGQWGLQKLSDSAFAIKNLSLEGNLISNGPWQFSQVNHWGASKQW